MAVHVDLDGHLRSVSIYRKHNANKIITITSVVRRHSPIRITGGNAATAAVESSNTCTDHTTAISCSQHGPAPPVVNIVSAADITTDARTASVPVDATTSQRSRVTVPSPGRGHSPRDARTHGRIAATGPECPQSVTVPKLRELVREPMTIFWFGPSSEIFVIVVEGESIIFFFFLLLFATTDPGIIQVVTRRQWIRTIKTLVFLNVAGRNTRVQSGLVGRRTAWRAHRTPTGESARDVVSPPPPTPTTPPAKGDAFSWTWFVFRWLYSFWGFPRCPEIIVLLGNN